MKIACFDNVGLYGGASRYSRALLLALKQQYPSLEITYFGNRASIERENFGVEFSEKGIQVQYINNSILDNPGFFGDAARTAFRIARKYFPIIIKASRIDHKQLCIEKAAEGFDLAFFPWNYLMECPDVRCPMIAVFHDFNFKYNFGASAYNKAELLSMDAQFPVWLQKATPIVSSFFTARELKKFYPEHAGKTRIIHLAPFSISDFSADDARKTIEVFGIRDPYIVYPTNLGHHKNVANLIRAMFLVKKRYKDLRLVLTGSGTESLTGTLTKYGVERNAADPDVIGLGYVTNEQMDALIQCARAVISTSLYEAGNGPGLDAWINGTPVIMSDIESFVEHRKVLGVKARLCDPIDVKDIARQIMALLADYRRAARDAESSRKAIQKYTWAHVAEQYYEVFRDVTGKRRQDD